MKRLKRMAVIMLVLSFLTACGAEETPVQTEEESAGTGAVSIELSDEGIRVEGGEATDQTEAAVYVANDIIYYEDGKDFTYGEGDEADAHSAEEAAAHTVVHITQPGTYSVSGTLSRGQIAVDLGEDAEEDPNAVVTLILNGVDITCTVAPAVMFYNVYECGSTDTETASKDVDTSAAGANVMIADGTTNTVNGSYVARIYKPESVELNEDGTEVLDAKKLHKYDAAFYSRMSMNVNGGEAGSGMLYINAENEGLDSELHLTLNGGSIDIRSGNDGINTNEDGVSVTTVNGGNLTIAVTGETGEGDGIDSNGWLVINGGTVIAAACGSSMDSGIDSDMGIHVNGGTVMASGHMLDRIEEGGQNYAVFSFAEMQKGGTEYTLKAEDGHMLTSYVPSNDFSNLLVSDAGLTAGEYSLWQGEAETGIQMSGSAGGGMMGGPGMGGMMPQMQENFDPSQLPEMPGGMAFPGGMELPEGFEPGRLPEEAGFPADMGQLEMMAPNESGTAVLPGGAVLDPGTETVTLPDGSEVPYGSMSILWDGTTVDPESNTITLPDGSTVQADGIDRLDEMGGFPGQGGEMAAEQSTVFVITDGGTLFSCVAPAE